MTEPVHGIWKLVDALSRVNGIGECCVSRLPGVDGRVRACLEGMGVRTVGELATSPLFHAAWECCHGCEGVEGLNRELERLHAAEVLAVRELLGEVSARALSDFQPFHVARIVLERSG